MKTLLFASMVILFTSCKKDQPSDTIIAPGLNKQIMAAVALSSGSTVNINATGSFATMGYGGYGYGLDLLGISNNINNTAVQVYAGVTSSSAAPGTYPLQCIYWPTGYGVGLPYQNIGVANPGSITFTTLTSKYAEGYFTAVCKYNMDSVLVSGTFKGDLN